MQPPSFERRPTHPLAHVARQKPRRWPLLLRVHKGAIHGAILVPVVLHSAFTAIIVALDRTILSSIGIPGSLIPSLSIVVGLMLVFRNQTSYDRFWTGRNLLTTCVTSVRNLTRSFLVCARNKDGKAITDTERADVEEVIRVLIASLYAIKHNLRAEWTTSEQTDPPYSPAGARGIALPISEHDFLSKFTHSNVSRSQTLTPGRSGYATPVAGGAKTPDYSSILPRHMTGLEDQGLGLPVQLMVPVEGYIRRGFERGWFHGPQSSQLTVQVNTLIDAYGKMETIRTTPFPVAHLIHARQVLALYTCVLPFTTVDDFGWWAIPIVAIVAFTLYGIEGIGSQLEDPFGYDKNDIKMDGIVEDAKQEVTVMLDEWRRQNRAIGMFNEDRFTEQ